MARKLKRPGTKLSTRPLHFYWIVDCSGSMFGDKIDSVNNAIQSVIPEMVNAAKDNPNAQIYVRAMKFATGAEWVTEAGVKVEDYAWNELIADGASDMGKAFELLGAELTIPPMSDRALPPVIVLLSDGVPTDNYRASLAELLETPWGQNSVRIALSIGQDADDAVLEEFCGSKEMVMQANSPIELTKMIKWASTVVTERLPGSAANESTDQVSATQSQSQRDSISMPAPDSADVW